MNNHMETITGKLQVINSQIILIPGEGEGSSPSLLPVPGLKIFVNEKLIHAPTPIAPEDAVKLESCIETVNNSVMDVKLSEDRLSASLRLKTKTMARYRILDTPESSALEPLVEKELYEELDFNLEKVYLYLEKSGVLYGLDHQAVNGVFSKKSGDWVEVARGYPPVAGEHARLEIFFETTHQTLDMEDILENVNYREKGTIPCVEQNALLAKKIPSTPGKSGKTVTGVDVHPRPVKDFYLKTGKNTSASEDGLEIFAAVLGQPILEQKTKIYTVTVKPVYVVNDDVDLNSGHIRFKGDIQVNGKIAESMEIHSEQNVEVKGGVNGALIKVEGSVVVRDNVINSRILAGTRQFYGFQVSPSLLEFESTLVEILKAYQQIKANPSHEKTRFGYIFNLLVEKKYDTFPKKINSFYQILETSSQADFSEEMINAIISLRKQLHDFKRIPYQEIADAVHILQSTQALKKFLNLSAHHQSNISAVYCLNSHLQASGSVTVSRQGCFHTNITAHESIDIKGIVRGGIIKAGKDIKLNEVGSDAAIKTNIIVSPGQTVSINKVFENTSVTIGGKPYKFNDQRSRVKVSLNSGTGNIEVSTY